MTEAAKRLGEQMAFPRPNQYGPNGEWLQEGYPGMTIRQRFAMAAMQGMVASAAIKPPFDPSDYAKWAVLVADALLEELAKGS